MLSGLIIGLLFGFLVQRSQFCFVSGFRNILTQRNIQFLAALFIAISVQSIGFFTLYSYKLIEIPSTQLPLLATLVGGFIFGFGMIMAGVCASGSWFRSGEGSIAPFLVLLVFSLTMATTHSGALKWTIFSFTKDKIAVDNIHTWLNISPWVLISILVFVTLVLIFFSLRQKRFIPKPDFYKREGFLHVLLEKRIHLFFGAFIIGLLGISAWYLSSQTGREYGYSIAVPSANLIEYLVTGQQRYLNWGSVFVLGFILGSFISSILSGDFKLAVPSANEIPKRVLGAFFMGIGASLAGGCTVTNALVSTAYFSIQGWLATFMIILGCFTATLIFKPTQCKI